MYASICKTTKETIIIFLIICASLLDTKENDNCPETALAWREKEASYSCGREKYYHCLKDEKQETVQTCLGKSWVQPGFCPEFNSIANEIDVFLCKESLGECPVATFWSNELYKYTACLNAVITDKAKPREENGGNKGSKGGLNVTIIIIVACSSLLLVLAVTIVLCFVFRKKKEENATGEVELPTLFNSSEENATDEVELPTLSYSSARNDKSQYKTDIKNHEEPLLKKRDVSIYPDRYSKTEDDGTGVQKLPPLERYPQKLSTVETNRALIENHLRKPGDRLVLVASLASAIDTFELELKTREPGYIKVDSFGDWSNVSEKEGCTVLLSCIMKACRDGSIIRHRRELENIAEEGGKLKLIIPVREDVFDIEKNNLSNLQLFQKIAYHRIA